jgi:hypothetical protein
MKLLDCITSLEQLELGSLVDGGIANSQTTLFVLSCLMLSMMFVLASHLLLQQSCCNKSPKPQVRQSSGQLISILIFS